MKVFVTGATGFIGTHVVRQLSQTDHKYWCLVRNTSKAQELEKLGARLVTGDVTDKDSLYPGMKGCDWVINLANLYSFWEPDKRIYRKVNVDGTRNIMECALETAVSKVIHVSTGGIYGKPTDCPFNEESTVGPARFSEYFRTKYEGDQIAWNFHKEKELPLVMIYPAAVLGPGDPKATGKYIQDLIHRRMPATVLHDSVLTWVHVRDVAEAILNAAEKETNIGEKYLVGKHQMSIKEFNELVSEVSGIPLPKICLPDFMVTLSSILLTWLANLTRKAPPWGMSQDQIRTMREGFRIDGSKVERELGVRYSPIREAIEEAIESFRL